MQLPEPQGKALDAIVAGRLAWSTAKELARLGHTAETLEALEAAGLVERWELPKELAWTLTSWGAFKLGLEIVEVGREEDPRWGTQADVVKYHRVFRQRGHYEMKYPELLCDPAPGPDVLIDPISEEPLVLFGRTVVIDKRLKRQLKAQAKKGKAKKPKGAKAPKRKPMKASA